MSQTLEGMLVRKISEKRWRKFLYRRTVISEKRVPFSPVRERDLFFSPVREEVITFERNISDRSTDQKGEKERKGEIMSIIMLESNERKLEHTQILPYYRSKLQWAKHGKLVIMYQHINIKLLFASNTFKAISEMVEMTRTIPYHPISNGLTERLNSTIISMIQKAVSEE